MNPIHDYPEFIPVEAHVRRAHLERAAHIGHLFGVATERILKALKHAAIAFGDGLAAERERRAIEADVFLRRSAPHR
ncbi:MAG TPA: hypothetical protein VH301_01550 [Usitatibacter sp.]|jgi:hypothetical protein|nr:hypothetical protein [Usitatibacter sp.]